MTKIDVISGFLGAGKTTLIKKLISDAYTGEKIVLIENEFGEIGIDGGFLQDAGIEITEMNSGCICCSLVGDFGEALKKVLAEFAPDRIIIEPSGVGKLSDVCRAVAGIGAQDAVLNGATAVVDAKKCKMYMKNFGEFFNDQIEHAKCIVLSHVETLSEEKIAEAVALLREHNKDAVIVTTPHDKLTGEQLRAATEQKDTMASLLAELREEEEICPECGHHHEHGEHHHHDEEHEHHHHHDDDDDEREHHHHHDDDDEHHHHGHDEHDHHHHEHGHHHADEVFTSWGKETAKKYTQDGIKAALAELENAEKYGQILRAKGIVDGEDGEWIYFDYVPGEIDVRTGAPAVTGRLCVIGAKINEAAIEELFG